MTSISQQIIQNSNQSAIAKAATEVDKKPSTSVSGDDFLLLLTEQLKYQDPTNPMDNNDMLAQEAQFQSLSQMESLTESFSKFANVFQANSLMGQNVEVTIDGKTTTGTVEYVDFSDSNGASISIGGKMYPLSSVTKMLPQGSVSNAESEEDKNFFKAAANSIASNLAYLTNTLTKSNDGSLGADKITNTESN